LGEGPPRQRQGGCPAAQHPENIATPGEEDLVGRFYRSSSIILRRPLARIFLIRIV
jgi:hypothetical protein